MFSKIYENYTRSPDVDPFGGRSLNLGDGASSKSTSLSRLEMMLLVASGSLCVCSLINRNRRE